MVRRLIEFVSPIALVACVSAPPPVGPSVSGVKAERPDVKVGDKYTFSCTQGLQSYERHYLTTSVDESSIKYSVDGAVLESTREGNPVTEEWVKGERGSHTDLHLVSFPLEVGKTWTIEDRWERFDLHLQGTQKGRATVVAYKKVRVPAGEFDAFQVQWALDFTINTGGAGRNTGTFWYAPSARASVKYAVYMAGEPEFNCELNDFQLRP